MAGLRGGHLIRSRRSPHPHVPALRLVKQLLNRDAELVGQPGQRLHREVLVTGLDHLHVPGAHLEALGQLLLGKAELRAQLSDAAAEISQKQVGFGGHLDGVADLLLSQHEAKASC